MFALFWEPQRPCLCKQGELVATPRDKRYPAGTVSLSGADNAQYYRCIALAAGAFHLASDKTTAMMPSLVLQVCGATLSAAGLTLFITNPPIAPGVFALLCLQEQAPDSEVRGKRGGFNFRDHVAPPFPCALFP